MKRLLMIILVLSATGYFFSLAAQATVLDFLKWDTDPAAVGRGGAGTGFDAGLPYLFTNPAHINSVESWAADFSRRRFSDIYFSPGWKNQMFRGAYRLDNRNVFGLFYHRNRMSYSSGASVEDDYSLGVTWGRKLSSHFVGGISVKYLSTHLKGFWDDVTVRSWAVDLGVRVTGLAPHLTMSVPGAYFEDFESIRPAATPAGISAGVSLLNAGPGISYVDEAQADPIPQTLRLGIAYKAVDSPLLELTGLFDFEKQLVYRDSLGADNFVKAWFTGWKGKTLKNATYRVGMEARIISVIAVRFGYVYFPFESHYNLQTGVATVGLGFETRYGALEFGGWFDREQVSYLYRDASVVGISIQDIHF